MSKMSADDRRHDIAFDLNLAVKYLTRLEGALNETVIQGTALARKVDKVTKFSHQDKSKGSDHVVASSCDSASQATASAVNAITEVVNRVKSLRRDLLAAHELAAKNCYRGPTCRECGIAIELEIVPTGPDAPAIRALNTGMCDDCIQRIDEQNYL